MAWSGKRVQCGLGMAVVALIFCASTVTAARITSPNYQIDGNIGGSFGGEVNSSSYRMTAIGGEAVVGNGASGSYLLDQQHANPSAETMQLSVQPNGLVGYYPMDENTGSKTTDASRYQNDGTLIGGSTWQTTGKIGSGVLISDGNTGFTSSVQVPDNANLPTGNQMTFEAWVKQSQASTGQTIAGQWNYSAEGYPEGGSGAWIIKTGGDGKSLEVYINNGPGDTTENLVYTPNDSFDAVSVWRHVAVTYDGTQVESDRVKIYIDGVLVSSTVSGTIRSSLVNAEADLSIGSIPVVGLPWIGVIDQAKLFSRALSAAEVKAEYSAQDSGAPSGFGLEPSAQASTSAAIDAIVRTNSPGYTIGVQQDHDLQSGTATIPAIGGSIASPATWSEGVTRGFGFTLTGAPVLDAKWNSGGKYAALPTSVTTFYSGTGNVNRTAEVINLQLRLHPSSSQIAGSYNNTVTYTGTMTP